MRGCYYSKHVSLQIFKLLILSVYQGTIAGAREILAHKHLGGVFWQIHCPFERKR